MPDTETTPKIQYATFNNRVLAGMIDTFVSAIMLFPLFSIAHRILLGEFPKEALEKKQLGIDLSIEEAQQIQMFMEKILLSNVLQSLVMGVVLLLLWKRYGATPGKMLFKMRIVDAKTGEAPTTGQWLWRLIGYIPATCALGLGFLWVAIDKRKQGWHDKMAGTVVLQFGSWWKIWDRSDIPR